MGIFIFNNPRTNQTVTIHDNGNDRPDAGDRVSINGHSYRADRIALLGPRNADRQAFEDLKSILRVSDFRQITSLSAAAEVYRNRLEANAAASEASSFVQLGTQADIYRRCGDANRLYTAANELAGHSGMGSSTLVNCSTLSESTRVYIGGSPSYSPSGGINLPLFTIQINLGSQRPHSPSPTE